VIEWPSSALSERWTHLVIRELGAGSDSFNDLRKGLPLISPTLLSKRLKSLESAGVVERSKDSTGVHYTLSEAGRELTPIILAMGTWGHRWVRSQLDPGDLDPSLLMWDIHRNLSGDYFGKGRTVQLFEFSDYATKFKYWWLIIDDGDVDVCLKDPGHEVDLQVTTDVRTLTAVWMGDTGLGDALRAKQLRVVGPEKFRRDMPKWLGTNYYADVQVAT